MSAITSHRVAMSAMPHPGVKFKRFLRSLIPVTFLCLFSLTAQAHFLDVTAAPDCGTTSVDLSFSGSRLIKEQDGDVYAYRVDYTLQFAPTDHGDPIDDVVGEIERFVITQEDPNEPNEPRGVFNLDETVIVTALAGRSANISGTATLTTIEPYTFTNTTVDITATDHETTPIPVTCSGPPTLASLGDRVWKDENGNGGQDAGEPGVQGVKVLLFMEDGTGSCGTSMIDSTRTDANGLYGFTDLVPGQYCVRFDISAVREWDPDFCDNGKFDLGDPLFTAQNQGPNDLDSDADVETGLTETVSLAAGQHYPDLDAGLICPGKIGDFVWLDSDRDGMQDSSELGVENATVDLYECTEGANPVPTDTLVGTRSIQNGDLGEYMFGAEPGFDLAPGNYYLKFTDGDGRAFTLLDNGGDELDSDCDADGRTQCITVGAGQVDLSFDCGVVEAVSGCDLSLAKSCRVEPVPPKPFEGDCNGKLQEFTVVWNGSGPVTVSGLPNNSTGEVKPGDAVTFFGPFDDNDVFVDISGADTGFSVFHMSCSDDEFNDPDDCGKDAGDSKGNDEDALNLWKLEGFVDAENQVLKCTAETSDIEFTDNCSFELPAPPSCETTGKPDNLTWRYEGGSCEDSTFFVASDFECDGSVDKSLPVTVTDDRGNAVVVNPGDEFTFARDASEQITLSNAGGTQTLAFHMSCSQPLEAGLTGGALRLVALDGQYGGVDVTYAYDILNLGAPLSNVQIVDVPLGTIASGFALGTGQSEHFEVMVNVSETTTNSVSASGMPVGGGICEVQGNSVTVEAVIPPCSVGFELDKVSDDAVKIKLTNNDARNRVVTLDTMTIGFPAARENLREVKLDGAIYKRDDSSNPAVGTSVTIGGVDTPWTEDDVSKRQLDSGETRTLEIKTTGKSSKDGRFEVTLGFAEGCEVTLIVENQQVVAE